MLTSTVPWPLNCPAGFSANCFQRQLRHKGVHLAIDLHDVPYYGQADQRKPSDH
jgi:hypothetical protein